MDSVQSTKKVKILLSKEEGKRYKAIFDKYRVKNEKTGNKKRIPSDVVFKILNCSKELELNMLYAIW